MNGQEALRIARQQRAQREANPHSGNVAGVSDLSIRDEAEIEAAAEQGWRNDIKEEYGFDADEVMRRLFDDPQGEVVRPGASFNELKNLYRDRLLEEFPITKDQANAVAHREFEGLRKARNAAGTRRLHDLQQRPRGAVVGGGLSDEVKARIRQMQKYRRMGMSATDAAIKAAAMPEDR
jgi:hypothetical protein